MTDKQRPPAEPEPQPFTEVESVAQPEIPPEFVGLSDDDVQTALREQRERLARPAGNVDIHGAPHFLRNVDGVETCGQDGKPWPCGSALAMADEQHILQGIAPAVQLLPTMAEAAEAAGLDLAEFEERLRQTRRR